MGPWGAHGGTRWARATLPKGPGEIGSWVLRGEQESVCTVRLWGTSNNCSHGLRGDSGAAGHESCTSHSGPAPRILSLRPSSPRPSPRYQAPRPSARNSDTARAVAFRFPPSEGGRAGRRGRRPQTRACSGRNPDSWPGSRGPGVPAPHRALASAVRTPLPIHPQPLLPRAFAPAAAAPGTPLPPALSQRGPR